jgi:cytoskeletal protein CcmA (bactofilin family)
MGLFSRREATPTRPQDSPTGLRPSVAAPASSSGSVIAVGSVVKGEVTGRADLTVLGEVQGPINLGEARLEVADGGLVKGEIRARSVRIAGRVTGNVRGEEWVEILASGALEGDLAAGRVIVAEGAFFKGSVEMLGEKPAAPKKS